MDQKIMLFQEDTQKNYREKQENKCSIFEGDESLLWARNKFNREYECSLKNG